MENMDKGLTVPKSVLTDRPKIHQMSQNLSAQFVLPKPHLHPLNHFNLIFTGINPWKFGQIFFFENGYFTEQEENGPFFLK